MSNKPQAVKTILLATLIAGTLGMAAAIIVYSVVMKVVTPAQILNSIAAALFGQTFISNKTAMAVTGLLLHYFITFCFATGYFFTYPHLSFLKKNAFLSGLLYGIIVWAIMNLAVVPLTTGKSYSFFLPAFLRQIITLIICIGLPISFITARYYKNDLH